MYQVDESSPANTQAPANRGLRYWWLCLPYNNRGLVLTDMMQRKDAKLQGSIRSGPNNRPGGYGSIFNNGVTDAINILPVRIPAEEGTVSVWWCPLDDYTINEHFILRAINFAPFQLFDLIAGTFGVIIAGWFNNFDNDRVGIANPSAPIGTWHHLAVTWKNGGDTTLWFDGIPLTSAGPLTASWDTMNSGEILLASSSHCLLDDIKIYDRISVADNLEASKNGYRGGEINWIDYESYLLEDEHKPWFLPQHHLFY